MQTIPLKLVTVVAESVLRDRLPRELMELGASGFTLTQSHGRGSRGLRTGSIPGDSVRIEVIVDDEVCDRILQHLAERYFDNFAVIGWATDVNVIRGEKYIH
jgi:nitrogen regulatory protein PII